MRKILSLMMLMASTLIGGQTLAQSLIFDDLPTAPLVPSPFTFPGLGGGAENPWGFATFPGVPSGPSPLLTFNPMTIIGDGDIHTPAGGALNVLGVVGPLPFISGLSDTTTIPIISDTFSYQIHFSVDRISTGSGGTAVAAQTVLNQQSSDIYFGGTFLMSPTSLIGNMGSLPQPFAGNLGAAVGGNPGNTLIRDEASLSIPADASGALLGPNVVAATIANGTHNNLDGFDYNTVVADTGLFTTPTYITAYPDALIPFGFSIADIYDAPAGGAGACGTPYALAASMGLTQNDVIDALVVFDNQATGSTGCGGPGAQAGIDGVLFSLAPGSPSLRVFGLSSADMFLSDFTGKFGLYASANQLGLQTSVGSLPVQTPNNVDAAELLCTGDLDANGTVDISDFNIIAACTGAPNCADVNSDGVTNFQDFVAVINNFGCVAN
ncbi:MAG: hypothetical protein AB8G18_07060 [Gammaproteobacteria bacterium]